MPPEVLIFLLVVCALYFVLVALPRKRARLAQAELLAGIEVGEEVLTAGGLIGVVRELDGEIVRLELAEGVVVRIDRRAIAGRVLPEAAADTTGAAPTELI
jgi:preprotein translocase subunit YajC